MTARVIPLRRAIDADYVREQLGVSRSTAYHYLQLCAADAGVRRPHRTALRIDQSTWETWYQRRFGGGQWPESGSATIHRIGSLSGTPTTATANSVASAPRGSPTKRQRQTSRDDGSETPTIRLTKPGRPRSKTRSQRCFHSDERNR